MLAPTTFRSAIYTKYAPARDSASRNRSLPNDSCASATTSLDPTLAIGRSQRLPTVRGPAHFTRRFRAAYGMTPSDWRREALERSDRTEAPPRHTWQRASRLVGVDGGFEEDCALSRSKHRCA
ncbi:helix-turn-helix transcriptional regulator [Nocardia sp. CA-128927]|uniref:helix-turn-helix transcriptional regulator n=1 Tax=Nocardia sp. CA-128927 TaxID=3239975 RepID=UPI003D985889